MSLNSVQYICPTIILVIIFLLKFTVDEKVCYDSFKRLVVETSVDIMSLATSFIVSFLITSVASMGIADKGSLLWEEFAKGIIFLVVYILFLIILVLCSKFTIRKYSETENLRYLYFGIFVGYSISIICLYNSISMLRNLGGV